jgi:hypothetical protein
MHVYTFTRPYWTGGTEPEIDQFLAIYDTRRDRLVLSSNNKRRPAFGEFEMPYNADGKTKAGWELQDADAPRTLEVRLRMRQSGDNRERGVYRSRHFGVRYGGSFFVSYPGKAVPLVLAGSEITVPGSRDKLTERAMRLPASGSSTQKADITIRLATANWLVVQDVGPEGHDITSIATSLLAIGAAVPGPHQPYFAVSAGALALLDAIMRPEEDGKSFGCFRAWYSRRRADGSGGEPVNTRDPQHPDAEVDGVFPLPNYTVWEQKQIQVGGHFSVWADLMGQAQMPAKDTKEWGLVNTAGARVRATFTQSNRPNEVKVECSVSAGN